MKAMIFAAGLGTRLRPLTDTRPKALVEVNGKPMLCRVAEKLVKSGFNEITINVHHFAEMISQYIEDNKQFGAQIRISDERERLLDTGGGLKKAWQQIFADDKQMEVELKMLMGQSIRKEITPIELNEAFRRMNHRHSVLVTNVDILTNCDYRALYAAHVADEEAAATLLVSDRPTNRYLLFDDQMRLAGWINRATGQTKPEGFEYEEGKYRELAFSGIQVVSASMFTHMPEGKYSIIDFYLDNSKELTIRGSVEPNLKILDIGKPETLCVADEFLKQI